MSQNREFRTYKDRISALMEEILEGAPAIEKAADAVAGSLARDQLLHVIGPGGHSSMAAEEVLWRAGGLAPVNAILDAGYRPRELEVSSLGLEQAFLACIEDGVAVEPAGR